MQGARFILNTRYFSIAKPGEQSSDYKLSREHVKKLVFYCGTRETVSLEVKPENMSLSVTLKQQQTIDELLKELQNGSENEGKETFEYKDYLEAPTRQNASELISRLSEIILYGGNAKSIGEIENLVDYAANRPGVVRVGEHGLFSSFPNVDLDKAAEEISTHEGNIWTHILSLRREDADKLGYDNQQPWRDLVMAHIDDIAEAHEIKVENLNWYAAMHNTGHHPHIHLFVYSADPVNNEGFFNEKKNKSISNLKSVFANDIFKDDPYFTYAREQKTEYRNELSKQSEKLLNELLNGKNAGFSDEKIELLSNKLNELADSLPSKGKSVYGFLPKEQKALVDEIQKIFVNENPILSQLYQNWCLEQNNLVKLYINDPKFDYPIESNKTFTKIKNDIIKAAKDLKNGISQNTDFEYVSQNDNLTNEKTDTNSLAKEERQITDWGEQFINHYSGFDKEYVTDPPKKYYTMKEMLKDYPDLIYYSDEPTVYTPEHKNFNLIYKSENEQIQKFKSLRILANDFNTRNGEICRKLADCYKYGNGCDKNITEALMWYGIAVDEFSDSMSAYRLAELYYYGADGIDIDNELANHCFLTAYIQFRDEIKNSQYFYALENNSEYLDYYDKVSSEDAYKEYLIGRMYMNGQGVEQDYNKAYYSFKLSATNGYSHSNYYIGNIYYYGLGFEQSFEKAAEYYNRAHENKDMYATYRLAKMYLRGEGVSVDLKRAENLLLECSDRVILANYDLAKIYEENPNIFNVSSETIHKYYKAALEGLLKQEQDKHDPFTEMRIGSMYLNGKGTDINVENAISWFDKASLSGNPDAAYQLAYIYSSDKYNFNDIDKANEYYKKALEGYEESENDNKNSTAEYRLGNMYFRALGTEQDIKKAISWFSKSMQNGNSEAAYRLAQIFSSEEYGFFDEEKANLFYKYAADAGHVYANYYLGKQEFENNNIHSAIEHFEKAAEGNISHAWYKLGQIHSNETSEFFNGVKAQACYANALKQYISDYSINSDDFTAYRIASMYMYGQGTEENLKEAVQWFEKSYEFRNPDAAYQLGLIHSQNNTEYFDNAKAQAYFTFAFNNYIALENEGQNSNVEYRIAKMFHNGLGTDINIDTAIEWYKKSLANGNDNEAFELGKIYYSNTDIPKDLQKAEEYFKISAESDNPYACYYLGNISLEKEDIHKAIEHFEKAAEGNISHAWYKLGQIYSNETSEFFNIVKAQECYANALKQYISDYSNNPDDFTAYRIASMHMYGQGTVINIPEAISWFEKSYKFGNSDAAYQLGNIYHSDKYGFRNNNLAYQYYNFAFNSYMTEFDKNPSDGNLAMRIGTMYHYGLGVERDIEKALSWYKKAVNLGNLKAQEKIDNAQNDKTLSALSIASTACHLGRIINTETQAAAKQHYASDHKLKRDEKLHKIAAGHAVSDSEQGYDY